MSLCWSRGDLSSRARVFGSIGGYFLRARASLIFFSTAARSMSSPSPSSARSQAAMASSHLAAAREHVAEVILNDGLRRQRAGGLAQRRLGLVVVPA